MADPNAITCAACGGAGDLHEHHLVPRAAGGASLPTVMLCIPCHGTVHDRVFDPRHVELTRAGLAAARARGVKLGAPGLKGNRFGSAREGRKAKRRYAYEFALAVQPHIEAARERGATTLGGIAAALTSNGVKTNRGASTWNATQVRRAIEWASYDPTEPYIRKPR